MALVPRAEIGATRRQSGHENSEDCGDGVDGVPKDQAKFLAPGDLINEASRARKKEADKNSEKFSAAREWGRHCRSVDAGYEDRQQYVPFYVVGSWAQRGAGSTSREGADWPTE